MKNNVTNADQGNGLASHQITVSDGIAGDIGRKQQKNKGQRKMKEKVVQSGKLKLKPQNSETLIDSSSDMVNSPPHYAQYEIECIDAIKAATNEGFEHYMQGNILKYLWRYRYKNGVEDLKKARWYLNRLIKELEE